MNKPLLLKMIGIALSVVLSFTILLSDADTEIYFNINPCQTQESPKLPDGPTID
jgi:hypothetical protein